MAAGRGDAASMVAVGLVWGATNALMRRGALVWDRRARASPSDGNVFQRWAALLLTWQYTAPFAANLCASAAFFALLGAAPISVAVPVTNAVTFAATAAAAAALGERVRPAPAVLGTALIVLGVWVCISLAVNPARGLYVDYQSVWRYGLTSELLEAPPIADATC